jgi:hypothetical protein
MRKVLVAGAASRVGGRLLLITGALLATAASLSAGPAAAGRARASGRVVFYSNVAQLVPGTSPFSKNTPSVRPNLVLMFADGSWFIKKLHWSSWGGPVARATGISSASNGNPNQAQGKRINHPVQFVLSGRRSLFGRSVYACYQLTDPKAPQTDQHDCLKHAFAHQYVYARVAGSPLHLSQFLSPDRKVLCLLTDNLKPGGVRNAFCAYNTLAKVLGQEYSATLRPDGQLATCAWQPGEDPNAACYQIWGSGPVLRSGQVDVIYQYRCQAANTAITCTVDTGTAKGKGFTISDAGVTPSP